MALSKQKKAEQIEQTSSLLNNSKLTVAAKYGGTPVSEMQKLRRQAKEDGTIIKVLKNRLLKQSMARSDKFSELPTDFFKGQLVYAFNDSDELAAAQSLAKFAKNNPQIEFVAAINEDGRLLDADEVKELAALPGKQQLRSQLLSVLSSPINGIVLVLGATTKSMVNVLDARVKQLN